MCVKEKGGRGLSLHMSVREKKACVCVCVTLALSLVCHLVADTGLPTVFSFVSFYSCLSISFLFFSNLG